MGAALEGATCENAPWTDPWFPTTLTPDDEETREVAEELEQQDRHITAETLEARIFFAVAAEMEDEDHDFWIAQAMGPMQCAAESMTDTSGNVMHEGENYVACHYLEWKNKATGIYKVETAAVNFIASHLVCISHLQLTRVGGGWKLPSGEVDRVIHATAVA
jgi:hypothetical protein